MRYRISDVSTFKPGEFFFSTKDKSEPEVGKDKAPEIISRLSFDPSLSSYYRVSKFDLQFIIFFVLQIKKLYEAINK